MSSLLVSIILSVCPITNDVTNECQEFFVNCAVGKRGEVTDETINKCLEKYRRQQDEIDTGRSSQAR